MKMNDFIFTKKRPEKYLRHIVFWIAQGVFWVVWAGLFFTPFKAWMAFVADCYQGGNRCSDDHNQTVNFIHGGKSAQRKVHPHTPVIYSVVEQN